MNRLFKKLCTYSLILCFMIFSYPLEKLYAKESEIMPTNLEECSGSLTHSSKVQGTITRRAGTGSLSV